MRTRTARGHTLMVLAAVLLLLIATVSRSATAAPTTAQHGPKPTVMLVHGVFEDASVWNGVIARLQHAGYPVIAPANPLRDLTTDSAYISSIISTIQGPVILAGSSYGGEIITNAAVGHPNVKALVYIAAAAPDQGETGIGLFSRFPGSRLATALITRSFPLPGGGKGTDAYVAADKYRQVLAADVPAATTALMAVTQRPVDLAALTSPSGPPAWKTIPSWYLIAGADQAIPPAAERFMADRAHAHTIEIKNASHVPMISHPTRTAQLIIAAATATR